MRLNEVAVSIFYLMLQKHWQNQLNQYVFAVGSNQLLHVPVEVHYPIWNQQYGPHAVFFSQISCCNTSMNVQHANAD